MTNEIHLIIKEDKIHLLRDMPEYSESGCNGKPLCCQGERCRWLVYEGEYKEALQKAKDNAVLVSNQEEAKEALNKLPLIRKVSTHNDTIFTLTGYKVEIKKEWDKDTRDPERIPMGSIIATQIELAVISPIEPEEKAACDVCDGTGVFEYHPELTDNPVERCQACEGIEPEENKTIHDGYVETVWQWYSSTLNKWVDITFEEHEHMKSKGMSKKLRQHFKPITPIKTEPEETKSDKCQAGCKIFTGGEIRHHKDCVFYPESFSKMYDDLQEENDKLMLLRTEAYHENEELRKELDRANSLNNQYKEALQSIFRQKVDLQEFVEATKVHTIMQYVLREAFFIILAVIFAPDNEYALYSWVLSHIVYWWVFDTSLNILRFRSFAFKDLSYVSNHGIDYIQSKMPGVWFFFKLIICTLAGAYFFNPKLYQIWW